MAESQNISVWQRIGAWYEGRLEVYDTPGIIGFTMRRHWTAKAVRVLAEFYLAHWQWIWGTAIGVASLWVAVAALK